MSNFNSHKRGVSVTGYGLIVGLIGVVAIAATSGVGSNVDNLFTGVGDTLDQVNQNTIQLPTPTPSASAPSGIQIVNRGDGVRRWADGSAATNCAAYRSPASGYLYAGETGDGLYEIASSPYALDYVYCDMTTAGGGWQSFFRGTNGSPNVFAHYESNGGETCSDVTSQCMRRLPSYVLASDEFQARCGGTAIGFTLPAGALNLFQNGVQGPHWLPLSNVTTLDGSPAYTYDAIWTGSSGNTSFIIATSAHETQIDRTLLSSYNPNSGWNYCNSVADTSTGISLSFRPAGFTP